MNEKLKIAYAEFQKAFQKFAIAVSENTETPAKSVAFMFEILHVEAGRFLRAIHKASTSINKAKEKGKTK